MRLRNSYLITFQKSTEAAATGGTLKKSLFLKVVSATFLLVCFVCLKESTCETRKNVFYFTSIDLFVLDIINS